jgi:hypothetical protein
MMSKEPTREQLAERAHQIFLRRGGIPHDGREIDDWLQAREELKAEAEASDAPTNDGQE